MQINPNLDIDNDIENLASGTLAMASNVVANETNTAIMSENAISQYIKLNAGEKIVGHISCSNEFVLFTSNNRILRCKEEDNSQTEIQTNWQWGGGEVIGCYTYNVKTELIIAISERIDHDIAEVPLKIINLDNPNYKVGSNDNQYAIAPEIPHYNMYSFKFVSGYTCPKGVYVLFIRFKRGEDYTSWFSLGTPIELFDKDNIQTVYSGYECAVADINTIFDIYGNWRGVPEGKRKYYWFYPYVIQDYVAEDTENVGYGIRITLSVELQSIPYEKFQIGYIVTTTKNEVKTYTSNDYDITVTEFNIDCIEHDETSVDDLTISAINIYNAHTMCNYNNRVYAANYWEENPNINVPKIDVSGITVSAEAYADVDFIGNNNIETGGDLDTQNETKTFKDKFNIAANRSITPKTVETIAGREVTDEFDEFDASYNYLIQLSIKFPISSTESSFANVRLHCNRFCYYNNHVCLLISVADLMHAIGYELTYDMRNNYFTYRHENGGFAYEGRFLVIQKAVNTYSIRLLVNDNKTFLNYPTNSSSVSNNTNNIFNNNMADNPDIMDWNIICINRESFNTDKQYDTTADLSINLGDTANKDITVTSCQQFESENALTALDATWFYDMLITESDGTEYRGIPAYGGNNRSQHVGYSNLQAYSGSAAGYNMHRSYNTWYINDANFIVNTLAKLHPDYTVKNYWTARESVDGIIANGTQTPFNNTSTDYVTVAYNDSENKFNFVQVTSEKVVRLANEIQCEYYVESEDGDGQYNTTVITPEDLNLNWNADRVGGGIKELIEYYESVVNDKYIWREDREPSTDDFSTDENYNGRFGKKVIEFVYNEGDKDPKFEIYKTKPIAVGFRNSQEQGDSIIVDKDFCIVIQLDEFLKAYPGTNGDYLIPYKPDYGDEVTIKTVAGEDFTGFYERFYILFRKQDTVTYGGETVYNGHFCYLAEDCSLNSKIPFFTEIYDFTTSDAYYGGPPDFYYPNVTNSNFSFFPFLSCAKFYASTISSEPISKFVNTDFSAEYYKCAINNAVYNFYIHYVLPDGNYTDGIKIEPNVIYKNTITIDAGHTYDCDENTTIGEIKNYCETNNITENFDEEYKINSYFDLDPSVHICNIFPKFDTKTHICVYINNEGDKFFRGNVNDVDNTVIHPTNTTRPIKFYFDNIPQPNGYVGYFISYEKPEHILIGTGPVVGSNCTDGKVEPQLHELSPKNSTINEPASGSVPANYPLDINSEYMANFDSVRFYCPEFNILKIGRGVNQLLISQYGIGGAATKSHEANTFYKTDGRFDKSINNISQGVGVKDCNIICPDDISVQNGGREGVIELSYNGDLYIGQTTIERLNSAKDFFEATIDEKNEFCQYYFGLNYVNAKVKYGITAVHIAWETYNNSTSFKHYLTIGNAIKHSSIYTQRNKTLIPLGYIKYYDDNHNYGYQDFPYNYDYYYNKSISIYAFHRYGVQYDEVDYRPRFVNRKYASEANYPGFYVLHKYNGHAGVYIWFSDECSLEDKRGICPFIQFTYPCYNPFNWNCVLFDQEPTEHYYTVQDNVYGATEAAMTGQDISTLYTKYVYPLYVNDLFKIDEVFKGTYTSKFVTNYDSTNYANFMQYYGKTIRRSQVISDESIENRWKIWRPDAYKMIDENKGNIINVVGIGKYLMAHCEHSLFIFDRSNQLDAANNSTVQTLMPDPFDIDYSEVFTVDKGYGGLQSFHQWCISSYGYVFFDSDTKKLFKLDDNKLDDISVGIKNLLNFTTDMRLGVEEFNKRIIICGTTSLTPNKYTISYNVGHSEWLSTHSYWFEDIFNTKSHVYFEDNANDTGSINHFNDNKYLTFINSLTDDTNYFKTELIDNQPASYIDVIFNNQGVDKVLDYITYRINKATDDQYSGNVLVIYSNLCITKHKDVSTPRRRVDDWKSPVYRFGIWVVNWFRNWIKPIPTVHPIIRGNGKDNPNRGEWGKQIGHNQLVVGKWWVVRLIFRDEDKRISVDDIETH